MGGVGSGLARNLRYCNFVMVRSWFLGEYREVIKCENGRLERAKFLDEEKGWNGGEIF